MNRAATRLAVVVALTCLSAGLPSAAVTIDDFEEGDFTNGGEQTDLSTESVAGGTRLVDPSGPLHYDYQHLVLLRYVDQWYPWFTLGPTTASLVTSPADDGALLSGVAVGTVGYVDFIYDGIGGDSGGPAASGTAGALNLDLTGVEAVLVDVTAVGDGYLQLALWDADSAEVGYLHAVPVGTSQVAIDILHFDSSTMTYHSSFPATTLSDIRQLSITAYMTVGSLPGTSLSLSNIQAIDVPEPRMATAAPFGIGLVVLLARRVRRR